MRNRERIYDIGMHAAIPLAGLLAPLHRKGSAAVQGRRESAETFATWSRQHRDSARPLVLVHAPSVGEALMAQAIIAQVRQQRADAQIAFTFFSPSTERVAARIGADVHGYLPPDTRSGMRSFTQMLSPTAVSFVRTEIWPMLGIEAEARGATVTLVNAVLAASSSRLRGPARYLLGPAYRRLHAIGAVSTADAERFGQLGVSASRTFVTGDARFDQVWNRVQSAERDVPMLAAASRGRAFIMVAGSTWPADDEVIIDAYTRLDDRTGMRLIIAPHEPTPSHLADVERRLDAAGVSHDRLSRNAVADPDAIVVDTLGVLADLYSVATIAYVGGGFGTSGLHSVVEPAALGVPAAYGPHHGNASEATELASSGGGFVIRSGAELSAVIRRMEDATARDLAGMAAETFVRSRLGGAAANAAIICGAMKTAAP